MTSDLQATIDSLQARADACMANGERLHAAGLIEAVQALRRLAPVAVKAPEPVSAPAVAPKATREPFELPEGV